MEIFNPGDEDFSNRIDLSSIGESESERTYKVYTFYGEIICFSILLIIGLMINGPLIYVYIRSKHIRSIADKFLFNMLIADMLCLCLLVPTILADLSLLPYETQLLSSTTTKSHIHMSLDEPMMIRNNKSLNSTKMLHVEVDLNLELSNSILPILSPSTDWTCAFKKSILSGVSAASILAALEIAIERHLRIATPLHYHKFLTHFGVVSTSVTGNSIALISALLSSLDPCQPLFPSCALTETLFTESFSWPIYTILHVSGFFIIPILVMSFIYIKICYEAKRQRAKIRSQFVGAPYFIQLPQIPGNNNNNLQDIDCSTSSSAGEITRRASVHRHKLHIIHPILLRFKLMDKLVVPRMNRAVRVGIFTLFLTTFCWGPYFVIESSHAVQSIVKQANGNPRAQESWNHLETILPLLFASLHPILGPLFYAYRYKGIREEVLKTLHLDRRKQLLPVVVLRAASSSAMSKSPNDLTPSSSEVGLSHQNQHLLNPPHHHHIETGSFPSYSPPSPGTPKFIIGGSDPDIHLTSFSSNSNVGPSSLVKVQVKSGNGPKFVNTVIHYLLVLWERSLRRELHRESVTSTCSSASLACAMASENNITEPLQIVNVV